ARSPGSRRRGRGRTSTGPSRRCRSSRRASSAGRPSSARLLVRLALVELDLERAAEVLAAHGRLVARSLRLEMHDAHVRAARPVAARVGLRLVERPQPELDPPESHRGIVTRLRSAYEVPPGSRKMSRTDVPPRLFESPSGTAT